MFEMWTRSNLLLQVTDDMGDDSMENNVTIEKDIKILHEARLNTCTFESVHPSE